MFEFFKGTIAKKTPAFLILDVNGVGYRFTISFSSYENFPEEGSSATVYSYLQVTDDDMRLFGFATEQERAFFRMLRSVSQVGPATAMSILSGSTVEKLAGAIIRKDESALKGIKGVGTKTAQRIIMELADDIKSFAAIADERMPESVPEVFSDAVAALMSLGYKRAAAQKAVSTAYNALGPDTALEDLVKKGLQNV